MCCDEDDVTGLPPEVVEATARYRAWQRESGWGWGEEQQGTPLPDFFRWARFSLLGQTFDELAGAGDWAAAVRGALGPADPPAGVVVVDTDDGLEVRCGPARPGLAGRPQQVDVIVLGDREVLVDGVPVPVSGGAGLAVLDLDPAAGSVRVTSGGAVETVDPVRATPAGRLRLDAPTCSRWSVTDATGGSWAPPGALVKHDVEHRPYWHAQQAEFDVPAGPCTVVAARGLEFDRTTWTVDVPAGDVVDVTWEPVRRFDPSAEGWVGGDLHVHLNYSGDLVLEPADAARMQAGEGLAVMQLAAGNLSGSLVYDAELLETTAGSALWSGDQVAVAGLEYRNDLLGHVHALGLRSVPPVRHTGHTGTDHPWDWPPNASACDDLRERGGLTTYAHPVASPLDDVADLFAPARTVEARELVADVALGLVDAVELVSCFDDRGAAVLYHHLLNCGFRPTPVAGTDVFLSFRHGPGVASNPPGWGRVYAQLDGAPVTAESFAAGIAAGRTTVTNGPWPTLDVDGAGPGAVLDRVEGDQVRVRATVAGSGIDRLALVGPDGELAATEGDELTVVLAVDGPVWLAAVATGGQDPHTLGASVFAHTAPVHVEVAGRRALRRASVDWCLRALDGLKQLLLTEARLDPLDADRQRADLLEVVTRARSVYRGLLPTR